MSSFPLEIAFMRLRKEFKTSQAPIVAFMKEKNKTSFTCLVGTLLSSRTKDSLTVNVVKKLFRMANTPRKMLAHSTQEIESLIRPVAFYKTKALSLRKLSRQLLDDYGGQVPSSMEDLLKLPGVGRKTANIVLAEAFGIPAISVDTHVHKLTNRWGLVKTTTPEKTEMALQKILPKRYWANFNQTLVAHGQTICVPVSPFCSKCVLTDLCPKIGVKRFR